MWKLVETKEKPAQDLMDLDKKMLEDLDPEGPAILHLYDWKNPSATYGHFIKPEEFLDLEMAKKHNLDLGKRPTGGGIIFHVSDLAFSVLVPSGHSGFSINTLENYRFVNDRVIEATKEVLEKTTGSLLPQDPVAKDGFCQNFCMAKPTIYDVMVDGRKIAGAAQRRRKQGFLHQGSISIAFPRESFLKEVLKSQSVLEAMQEHAYSLLGKSWTDNELQSLRVELKSALKKAFLK